MKKYLLIIIACMCMSFSCAPKESDTLHLKVKVTNNADYPLYISYGYNNEVLEYPWSIRPYYGGAWPSEHRINPGETNTTAIATIRPSSSIEDRIRSRGPMKVFFVDATLCDQTPENQTIPNEALLDSRVYDLEDLRAIDFHIIYP